MTYRAFANAIAESEHEAKKTLHLPDVRAELYALGLALVVWRQTDDGPQYRVSFTPVSIETRKAIDAGAFFTFDLGEALRVGRAMAAAYRLGAENA